METSFYKMTILFKKHCLALILAVLFGVLMILPFFYFESKLGENFKGILPEIVNDENFYYVRIKDAMDGHPFLGNAYLSEHKNELPQQVFLAEWLLAQPLKLFHIGVQGGHLIYNFFLPLLAFILGYTALYLITRSRLGAIIFSSFLFFGLYLFAFIRPISPQFNFIFWLTQFIFLWLLLNSSQNNSNLQMYPNSTNKISSIRMFISRFGLLGINALNFGLLFYIYPYYWTFYLIFFGVFIALNFINSKYSCNPNYGSKEIIKVVIGGLILAIPYFYLNYLTSKLPYYTETLTRLGMIYSHFPSGFRIIFWSAIGLAAFCWFLWKKIINLDIKSLFFISGILASVIAVNQHLITGRNFEFSSHYDMAAMFFLVFVAAYLLENYLKIFSNTAIYRCIAVLLILAAATTIFYGLFNYSKRVFVIDENATYWQNYAPVFDWLNKNTPKDSVVYANPDLSRLIPVYTANNVFYIREANLFFISDKEVLDRFILNNYFEKFDENFIVKNDRSIYGVRYIDAYGHAVQGNKLRRLLGLKPEPEIYLPEEAIKKVMMRVKELQKGGFIEGLRKFRVDYLVWDKNKNPNWKMNSKNFKTVFLNGDLIIFKFTF